MFSLLANPTNTKALLFGIDDFSRSARQVLEKFGNETIQHITIGRTPLPSPIVSALNIGSAFEFQKRLKESEYDKLFHLFINITTTRNKKILIEKNSVINIVAKHVNTKETETQDVVNVKNIKINELLNNARKRMGKNFFTYNAITNNCQNFILELLQSNGMGDENNYAFIKQDLTDIFKNLNKTKRLTNFVTSLGATADILAFGASIKNSNNYKKPLSNIDIINICKSMKIPLKGVIMKDEINELNLGNWVVNLQNSNQNGSHWCCLILTKTEAFYFDSFGASPPEQLYNFILHHYGKVPFNNFIVQNIKSILCGYFCIGLLKYVKNSKRKSLHEKCNDYINIFEDNTKLNDNILIKYLS
jgi:hypothetical protein